MMTVTPNEPAPAKVEASTPKVDAAVAKVEAAAPQVQAATVGDSHPPRPAKPNRGPHKSSTQIAAEIHAGWWGEESGRDERLKNAGFDPEFINKLVAKGVGKTAGARLGAKPSDES